MEGDSLKLNFEIALEKIDTLTKQNNELLDTVDDLEDRLKSELNNKVVKPLTADDLRKHKFDNISKEADAAMNRFTSKLRKEFKNAKSKQSQGQPVWARDS